MQKRGPWERRALLGVSPWSAGGFGDGPRIGVGLHLLQANSTASISKTFIFLLPLWEEKQRVGSVRQRVLLTGTVLQTLSL